jgi:citrate lyase subunit beta/citryl-CoA lyase
MMNPPLECTLIPPALAPCEHIAGNEKFALKAFAIQQRHISPSGRSYVDVTLDLEDGAPIGQEEALRHLFARLINSDANVCQQVGVRIHPATSPHCTCDLEVMIAAAGSRLSYITVPKVRSVRDVRWIAGLSRQIASTHSIENPIPLHLLIETPEALHNVFSLAAIPEVQTLDFGLMDYISHSGGGIPATAMRSPEQFDHRLVNAAKIQIAQAALAHQKIPSHNVTVNVRDPEQCYQDAFRARHEYGFLRMWSIHPDQIDPILRAILPSSQEISEAQAIIAAAAQAQWGPIEINGRLHDRASFRYYWSILQAAGIRP